jgi:putative transcriptional regulator
MLDAIESLDSDARRSWSECRLREFNIGYDCGYDPWAFNQGLTADTLHRISAAAASLRITLYPLRPARGQQSGIHPFPDVASVREMTGLSQERFAQLMGVSVRTLRDWEQGRRAPAGAARTLLLIAAKNPRALSDVASHGL